MRKKIGYNLRLVGWTLVFSLCFVVFAQAQNYSEQLSKQVSDYSRQNLQEKVYLHTDKTAYLAGETIWFKVYNVEGARHTPLSLSKVAYVEILDKAHTPVLQTKVALAEGTGAGSLLLPTNLSSGNFLIRAYTSWMKNTGAAFFFQQPLTIVNTLQPLGLEAVDLAEAYDVQFFPEGGDLVNGLSSKVAFKATDKNGRGVSFIGAVVNQKNDTVARFYTHKFGIGSFSFTPVTGHSYRAILRGDKKQVITRALPTAKETGMVMHVTDTGAEGLKIQVASSLDAASQLVYLLVHTRQEAIKAQGINLDAQGRATFTVDKATLGDGISHFTIFNAARQPVCERLYFQSPRQPLRLAVTADKREYAARSLVNLSLQAQNIMGQAAPLTNASVAVYRMDSLAAFPQQMIEQYLWLSSDLHGAVESPEYYFSNSGPEVTTAQDNLMLTHGWQRFSWEKVLQLSPAVPAFLPEYSGHLLYGRVLNQQGVPVPFVPTYLSSPSRRIQFSTSMSKQNGVVVFDLKNLYGTRDLILQADSRADSTLRLEINTPFSSDTAVHFLPAFDLKEQLRPQLQAASLHLQVQNHHHPIKEVLPPSVLDSSTFYGKPSRNYFLDDYTRFPTLEDVLREYVALVTVRKRKGKFHFMIVDIARTNLMEENPLVMLDGVPAFDLDHLMTIDPKKVRKVEVVARRFFHGGMAYGGIISFTTYQGNLEGFEVDPKALLVEYEGLQHTREFFQPVYDNATQQANRVPDLRTTLFWAPAVKIDATGKKQLSFYTSDVSGKYLVVVQGLTADGKAGSATYAFDVKPAS